MLDKILKWILSKPSVEKSSSVKLGISYNEISQRISIEMSRKKEIPFYILRKKFINFN